MAHQSKARTHITTNPLLKELLSEMVEEFEKTLDLQNRLTKEKDKEKREILESQLYVTMVRSEAKLESALKEWDRVVDEELE
ncbi:hypothetical protein HYR54_11040 [Candidatus Acetothermia bacterium]|nr:hypothetical protein [Candidatus Acetothermia bacterium]MBI3461033.1 hypothetical protein [Candidatus Acetothermia bacterium]MBI3660205.1 hypothetical protein [Candidatus Acetothermia bacterium]